MGYTMNGKNLEFLINSVKSQTVIYSDKFPKGIKLKNDVGPKMPF
jgi:hypothetical protein